MSGTQFDDPNRQAVGLDPIWTDAENPPEVEPPDGDLPGSPGSFTISAVQHWVDSHPHLAADVLTHEEARGDSARVTLLDWLRGFVESHDGVDTP